MSTVQNDRTSVQEVLRGRPYLRWDLVPLAAFLCEEGYSDGARNCIIDGVASGASLQHLVASWDLEPADLDGAERALARGRRRARKGRRVQTIGDLLNVIVGSLRACGVEPEESSLDAGGFALSLGGGPIRVALIPPVAGGGPAEFDECPPDEDEEPCGGYIDALTDEQIDAMAGDIGADDAELMPEDFELEPVTADAPDAGRSWSEHLGELIATGRTAAIRPVAGGAPAGGPTDEDVAEAHEICRGLDARDERRRAEDGRHPLYGYE